MPAVADPLPARPDLGRWLALALALSPLACPPLATFVFPGLLLWRFAPALAGGDPLVRACLVPAVSAAFWAVLVQWLRVLPLPLGRATMAIGVVTLALLLWPRRVPAAPPLDREGRLAALVVLAGALLRLTPLLQMPAPSGGDMSMHTAMARLMADADGWPSTMRPYLPFDGFGSYPLGFHIGVAVGLRGGADVLFGPLLGACLAHALAMPALFSALRRLGARALPAALGAATALYICALPQTMLDWGGAPTVLGFDLLCFSVALVPPLLARSPGRFALLGLCAAGMASAHLIPVVVGVYTLSGAVLYLLVRHRKTPGALALFGGCAAAGALALGLDAPYLFGGFAPVSAYEHEWVRDLVRGEHAAVLHSPLLWGTLGPLLPLLGGAGLFLLRRDRPDLVRAALLCLLGFGLAFASTFGFWLPQSELLYPSRMSIVLHLPLGVGVAALWQTLLELPTRPRARALFALGVPLAGLGLFMHLHEYQFGASEDVSVTADDRRVLAWVERNVPPDALIANNYGDAGLWIPAVARRAITRVHSSPFYFSEFLEARKDQRADWVYVGARAIYPKHPRPWRHPDADQDPRLEMAFSAGRAAIYHVIGAPIHVPPEP